MKEEHSSIFSSSIFQRGNLSKFSPVRILRCTVFVNAVLIHKLHKFAYLDFTHKIHCTVYYMVKMYTARYM